MGLGGRCRTRGGLGSFGSVRCFFGVGAPSMLIRGRARSFLGALGLGSFGGFGGFGSGGSMLFNRPRTVPADPSRGWTKRPTHSSVLGKLMGPT